MKLGVDPKVAHHRELCTALNAGIGFNGRRVFFSPSSDNGTRLRAMHTILVSFKVRFLSKSFVALVTLVRPLPSVSNGMGLQVCYLSECSVTLVTLVGALVRVDFLVGL